MSPEKVIHLKNICVALCEVQKIIEHFNGLMGSKAVIDSVETEDQIFNFESKTNQIFVFNCLKEAMYKRDQMLKEQLIQKATELIEPYKNND